MKQTLALISLGLTVAVAVLCVAQEPVTLGLDSADGLTLDAPEGYTQPAYSFGSLPVRDGEPAQGLTVTLSAGEGLVLYGPSIETGGGEVLVECAVWCTGPDVGLALVAMNLPDYSMMANLPASGEKYTGGWRIIRLLYDPDVDTLMLGFQIVSTANPDTDVSTTVFVDEIVVTPLNSLTRNQVGELLGIPVIDTPTPTSTTTPTPTLTPTATETPIPTDTPTSTPTETPLNMEAHASGVTSVAFTRDGASFLTAGEDRLAKLWNAETGELLTTFSGHKGVLSAAAISPGATRVVTASADKTVRVWDAPSGRYLRKFAKHRAPVLSAVFSPSGEEALTGGGDDNARLWRVESGKEIRVFTGHRDDVTSVAFSSDGQQVLTGSADWTAALWDRATGELVRSFIGHSGRVEDVAFSSDRQRVFTASEDGSVRVWDTSNGETTGIWRGHESGVRGLAFSADDAWVLTAGEDQTVKLWNVAAGTVRRTFEGHSAAVTGVALSPDGGKGLSGSEDGTVRLWALSELYTTPTPIPAEITIDLPDLPAGAKPLEMILIQPGTFIMGAPSGERNRESDETPHQVTISKPFYIGTYEVTQAQWEALMGGNPSYFDGSPNRPVDQVSWNDCQIFIQALNALGQGFFRLPTEAEWEYACRAGTDTRFSFGDALACDDQIIYCALMDEYMWWCANNDPNGSKEVGSKLPNPWGLYDMHGNVLEWCLDWYGAYPIGLQVDPQGATSGSSRVLRGGTFRNYAQSCRAANRGQFLPSEHNYSFGFRLVRESEEGVSRPTSTVPPTPTSTLTPTRTPTPAPTWTPVSGAPEITIGLPDLPGGVTPLEMVLIQPGTFVMGSPDDETVRSSHEGPQNQVTISKPFYLGKFEVTQAQWEAMMRRNPSYFSGKPNHPVEQVSWNDCQVFIERLNALGQGTFRLPTEAEWEYALRAGTTTNFFWGDDKYWTQADQYAWYDKNTSLDGTKEVGQKQPSLWGLHDMSGNVYEWYEDWYGSYSSEPQTDPQGPQAGSNRILRGGSWYESAQSCRSSRRGYHSPNGHYSHFGLRLVREYVEGETVPTPTPTPTLEPAREITIELPGLPSGATPLEMVLIPAGTFTMGSPAEEQDREADESPQHEVTLSQPFYIGVCEITQAQWEALTGENPAHGYGVGDDYPVYNVSWDDCQTFIERLNSSGRGTFRLPTESEWEYACRAGTTTRYYWGEDPADAYMSDHAWYYSNSSKQSQPVGQKLPNPWGLHDMGGNVEEWCLDWYGDYPSGSGADPSGPASATDRARRGSWFGAWGPGKCRSAERGYTVPDLTDKGIGLRLVREYP